MLPPRRILGEWALLAALLASLAGLAAWQDWLWRLDRVVYDAGLALGTRTAPDDIVIVAIDEESLARIGRWPWRRAVHATLVERLTRAEARAVGLDLIFTEPEADDEVLAAAIGRNGRVVLPVAQRSFGPGLLAEGPPVAALGRAAAGLGHIETELDADGIARGIHLWAGMALPRHPQFALALLAIAEPALAARHPPATGAAGNGLWQRSGWLQPAFAGPPGTYRTVSYVDVLTGAVSDQELRGKLVLVGATAAGLGDAYPTPMSGLGRSMPGVELHATILDALRDGGAVAPLARPAAVALAIGACLAVMLAHLLLSPRGGLLLSAALTGGTLVGAVLLLHWGGRWLPPAPILLGVVLAHPLWSWRRLEAAQRFMDAELDRLRADDPSAVAETSRGGSLEQRIAIVRAATERQQAARQAREDTLRFISHDLRAPLASIVTVAEDAVGPMPADDGCLRLQLAGRYAQNALDLADDLVRLGRAEAADPSRFAEVELAALADEAVDETWALATRKAVSIDTQIDCDADAAVLGDRALLRRALGNLLTNAIRHSPAGGRIRMTVGPDGPEGFRIDVADQGDGIAADRLPGLFGRYHRGSREDESRGTGVGLGLLIVKTVVERHGGSVAVASEPGRGACFTIRLPSH